MTQAKVPVVGPSTIDGGVGNRRLGRVVSAATIFLAVLLMVDAVGCMPAPPATATVGTPMFGLTFSQRQADYLKLPWQQVYGATLDLSPGLLRLGVYWDQVERIPGRYDFSVLDAQLDQAREHGQDVILTVGMKAPRWPEYFLPAWLERRLDLKAGADVSAAPELRDRTLTFVELVVRHARDRDVIVAWQVENEPLDPSGPKRWRIDPSFLAKEVTLVRSLDDRPIVVTAFLDVNPTMNLPWRRSELRERAAAILAEADVLGLDLYPSRGFHVHGHDWYFSWPSWIWEPAVKELRQLALSRGKAAWVMEAQAEPWEPNRIIYTDAPLSRSVQPPIALAAVRRLEDIGFDTILLWGVEHWYMRRKLHQQSDWWSAMTSLFRPESDGRIAVAPRGTPASAIPARSAAQPRELSAPDVGKAGTGSS